MQSGEPSRTAMGAAVQRAAHQVLDGGFIFPDPLALPIVGVDGETVVRDTENDAFARALRLFIAVRSRLSEDALAIAVARGVRQMVVLGAGLDTYAYRSPFGSRLRIFEVDHPSTQAWKRERLAAAAIPVPSALTFAPVDFERETLVDGLSAAGFDPAQPTFFTWLGVVPYLSEEAIFATLTFVAGMPGGAHVVFDYANPMASASEARRIGHEALAARVAAAGEAFKSFFETDLLCARLAALGYREIDDLGPAQIAQRYFTNRVSAASDQGGHIVRASTI